VNLLKYFEVRRLDSVEEPLNIGLTMTCGLWMTLTAVQGDSLAVSSRITTGRKKTSVARIDTKLGDRCNDTIRFCDSTGIRKR
jgi:hypothetical protein